MSNLPNRDANETAVTARTGVKSLAAGGLIAGILASSCCILPLALVMAGIGGTWMSRLTALAPYQPYFLAAAALFIGFGLRRAYRKPEICLPGTLCAVPHSGTATKAILWVATTLTLAAVGVDLLVPYII